MLCSAVRALCARTAEAIPQCLNLVKPGSWSALAIGVVFEQLLAAESREEILYACHDKVDPYSGDDQGHEPSCDIDAGLAH